VFFVAIVVMRKRPQIVQSSPLFTCMTLVGVMLMCGGLVVRGFPRSPTQCTSMSWLLSVGFVATAGGIINKLYRVNAIFSAAKGSTKVVLTDLQLMHPWIAIFLLENAYHLARTLISPYVVITDELLNSNDTFFFKCRNTYYVLWTVLLYSTKGCMLIYGVYLALKARSVPDAYNESFNIGVVMCTCAVMEMISTVTLRSEVYMLGIGRRRGGTWCWMMRRLFLWVCCAHLTFDFFWLVVTCAYDHVV
jgi:hypothetical protein